LHEDRVKILKSIMKLTVVYNTLYEAGRVVSDFGMFCARLRNKHIDRVFN